MDGDGLMRIGPTVVRGVPGDDEGPSLRVVAKLGAVREGVARIRFWLRSSVRDALVFSLVGR